MPEHSVITDPNIHEPKGISTASAGDVYVADGVGSGSWEPLASGTPWSVVVKTADQSITSSTTLVDDNELQFPVEANTNYLIIVRPFVSTGTGGYKLAATAPASPTLFRVTSQAYTNDSTITASSSATNTTLIFYAVLKNGANAGTFKLRIAQNASNATASNFLIGSYIEYRTF